MRLSICNTWCVWFRKQPRHCVRWFLLKTSDAWKTRFGASWCFPAVFCRLCCTTVEGSGASSPWRESLICELNSHLDGSRVQRRAAAFHLSVIQTLHRLLCLFGERPQQRVLIPPLTVLGVEVVLVNIIYHRVRDQVFHALPPSQGPADFGRARLVPHPLLHQEDVLTEARERVRIVHGSLGLKLPSTDADEAKVSGDLLHVIVEPQAGDLESVEEISSTQELQLGARAWGERGEWDFFCTHQAFFEYLP